MRIEDFHDLGLNEEELAELEQSLQLIGQAVQQEEEIPLPDSLRGEALLPLPDISAGTPQRSVCRRVLLSPAPVPRQGHPAPLHPGDAAMPRPVENTAKEALLPAVQPVR